MNKTFLSLLPGILSEDRILTDELSLHAYAHDASPYLLIPKVVLMVESEAEVAGVLKLASHYSVSVTFRAAGTSLSGQAQSDSVLMVQGQNWRNYKILDNGARIRLQPGLTGAEANLFLLPYQRQLGPDPASLHSAKIGGIAANNASGICCGIRHNSYQTLCALRVIFADGAALDTEEAASVASFTETHAEFLQHLTTLRDEIRADAALTALIRQQYRIKNTLGYSLNSFIDFDAPLDILTHLMIGSEGTLGFIAAITYRTLPHFAHEAAIMLYFESIETACAAALLLRHDEIAAIELMDATALKAAKHELGLAEAALLVDLKAESESALKLKAKTLEQQITEFKGLTYHTPLLIERNEYQHIWAVRRGILAAVAGARTAGTALINEDVAVDPENLPSFCTDLKALFKAHGYKKSCIFGHVKDGNLHFLLEADFNSATGIEQYNRFMQALVALVGLKYQGALKAEHGTGRNMAPFVERAWGENAYRIMLRIKKLFDPFGILNPDVILSQNKQLHATHLKTYPLVDSLIDRCIECGFCERVCPSRKLTLTPRQRIVALRDMKRLGREFAGFEYRGVDTCAATGLCKTVCPVNINTGDMIRKQRYLTKTDFNRWLIRLWIRHFALVMKVMKWGSHLFYFRQKHSQRLIQRFPTRIETNNLKTAYYFPSCSARLFSNEQEALLCKILQKLGYRLERLTGAQNQCCGLMFNSKGYLREARIPAENLERFLQARKDKKAPILCEMGSCVLQMKQFFKNPLPLYDMLEFIADLLQGYPLQPVERTVMLHVTCSIERLGLREKMIELAHRCAKKVIIPPDITCCGFAGEKGFSHPELNKSALSTLKAQVPPECHEGYSMSLTCEMGLTRAAGIPYRSLIYLVAEAMERIEVNAQSSNDA